MIKLNHTDCVEFQGESLTDNTDDRCDGITEYHSVDPGRAEAVPRCERHWLRRLERRENSIEKYENSDVVPSWFDPAAAGESW